MLNFSFLRFRIASGTPLTQLVSCLLLLFVSLSTYRFASCGIFLTIPDEFSTLQKTPLPRWKNLKDYNFTGSPENVVLIKKHKSASSSLIQVIRNYLHWRGVINERPLFSSLGGCYPAKWDPRCRKVPHPDGITSFFYHHRFNPQVQRNLAAPGTVFISSIREPYSLFLSTFNFFYYRNETNRCNTECLGEPFKTFFDGETGRLPDELFDILEERFSDDIPWSFRCKNYQSFELGFENGDDPDEFVAQTASHIDFMIVTEYINESLVLLADFLNMPLELAFFITKKNATDYPKPTLSPEQQKVFEKFFSVDRKLYDFYHAEILRKIEEFGKERMELALRQLKEIQKRCEIDHRKCLQGTSHHREKLQEARKEFGGTALPARELVRIMEQNGGYCATGAQQAIREGKPMPSCLSNQNFSFEDEED